MLTTSPTPNAQIGAHSTEASQMLRNLQYAIAQCHDAIFITDPAGIIARVNPAFESLTGYSSHEAVGKDLSILTADGPHSAIYRKIWERILQQRSFSGSLRLRRMSEECLTIEITVTPVLDLDGQVESLVCTCHPAEETYPSRSLNELPSAKPEQVKEVAHALNNLLMVATSYADLAFDALPVENPVRVQMQVIKQACRRAADVVGLLYELERQPDKTLEPAPLHYQPSPSQRPAKAPATEKAQARAAS